MSFENVAKPYFFTLGNEIGGSRWKDIPLAVHGFTQENHRKSAIKSTPTEIAGILSHLPPNGPILFSFDYHDTLISREQELFHLDFITKFHEIIKCLTQSLGDRAFFVINSQSEILEKFDSRLNLPILFGNGFGVLDEKGKRKILPDNKMRVFNNVCERLGNPDSGIKFIRKSDGYGFIEIDTIIDRVPLGRIPIIKLLEEYIAPEEAELLDIYWGSNGRKIKFFPETSKLESGQQFLADHDYDSSTGVYIHFGDDTVDIPTENNFMANYFITSDSSPDLIKISASYIEKGGPGEFVLNTLDHIHKALLMNSLSQNPFSKHPYSIYASLSDMKVLESNDHPHRLSNKSNEINLEPYKEAFFIQMNRLAIKLIDALGFDISNTAILPILRGGIVTGIDLANLLFKYTGIKIPVEGIKLVFPTSSDLLRISTAQTTVESLLRKYPNLKTLLLVDDWIGAGKQMLRHKAILETVFSKISKNHKVYTVSPIDPIGICDFGEPQDILNPYSALDESPGIKSAEMLDGKSVTKIAEVEDRHLLLKAILDFQRRSALPRNNIRYINNKPKIMPDLGQYKMDWGLGINEALHRARKGHIVLTTPIAKPLMEQLGINFIEGESNFPFGWQAISFPKDDLPLLIEKY